MRLVTRLTVGFFLVVMLMISLHEYRQLGDRQTDFERDMDRTHLLVASTLADSVGLVSLHEGRDAALKSVEVTDTRLHGDLRVRWVCLEGRADAPEPPVPCASLAGEAPVAVSREGAEGSRRFTLVPVFSDGQRAGSIEVSESPAHEGAWVRQHFNDAVLLSLMTVVGMGLAAFVLGVWLVARPTRALMDKARAVGRGELQPDLKLGAGDELTEVADELNAMCRQLDVARQNVAREAAARLAAVEQLRHADRLATVGRLASGLAHELGTPLNVIEARAGLILEDAEASAGIQASAKVIIACSEQVTRLVKQLLDFARPRKADLAPLSLDGLAHRVVELLTSLAGRRRVELQLAVTPVAALADDVLLQQAVTNIVVNAVHACREGGHVTLTTGEAEVTRPGDPGPKKWCTLAVRDDGTGMSDEVRASIFEPFFTTKPVTEGTGLGLPIAVSILEEHKGFLTVQSAPGQGSTFTLHLEPASAKQ